MIVSHQTGAVAVGPHQSLTEGRLELAMNTDHTRRWVDGDKRAVDRAPGGGPLSHTHVGEHPTVPNRVNDWGEPRALDLDRLVEIPSERRLLVRVLPRRTVGRVDPDRIAGHKGLGKGNNLSAALRGLANAVDNHIHRRSPIQIDRSGLNRSNTHVNQSVHPTVWHATPAGRRPYRKRRWVANRRLVSCSIRCWGSPSTRSSAN